MNPEMMKMQKQITRLRHLVAVLIVIAILPMLMAANQEVADSTKCKQIAITDDNGVTRMLLQYEDNLKAPSIRMYDENGETTSMFTGDGMTFCTNGGKPMASISKDDINIFADDTTIMLTANGLTIQSKNGELAEVSATSIGVNSDHGMLSIDIVPKGIVVLDGNTQDMATFSVRGTDVANQ